MSQSSFQDSFTGWQCQRLLSSFLDLENSSVHLVGVLLLKQNGAKSEEQIHEAVDILVKELKEIGATEEPK